MKKIKTLTFLLLFYPLSIVNVWGQQTTRIIHNDGFNNILPYAIERAVNHSIQAETAQDFKPDQTYSLDRIQSPLKLVDFYLDKSQQNIVLNWTTPIGINSDSFEVEHSTDGLNFNTLAVIAMEGNHDVNHHYKFIHQNPIVGNHYYRLKIRYPNNSYEYSQLVHDAITAHDMVFSVYPNPAPNGQFIISLKDNNEMDYIRVVNMNGETIYQKQTYDSHLEIDLRQWGSGIYKVIIDNDEQNKAIRKILIP